MKADGKEEIMKELKFNINYLVQKMELYYAFIGLMTVSFTQIFLVVLRANYLEFFQTSEYLLLPMNTIEDFGPIIVLAFPVITALIYSDSSWLDRNRKTNNMLYTRLNIKKNIICRVFLSFAVSFMLVFFVLLINYICLRIIFGSGIRITLEQSLPFNINGMNTIFLDNLRITNPTIYAIVSISHVSFLLGMLSSLSYCISFFVRQRLVIYFQVLLIMFCYELIITVTRFENISIIKQLQLMSHFTITDALILYIIFVILIVILLKIIIKREEIL